MQRVISMIGILLFTGMSAAQDRAVPRNATRVVTEGRPSILRLAPRFTTTIRLPEPVTSVILGDSNLFQAEHSPNEPLLVFVKPTTPTIAQTNLLITTTGGRQFPLLLKTDGEGSRLDSGLDLLVIGRTAATSFIEETYSTSLIAETLSLGSSLVNEKTDKPEAFGVDPLAQLIERQRKRPLSNLQGDCVQVGIGYVEERNSQFLVSFSVLNSTNEPVELMPPQVQLAGQTKSGVFKQSLRWTTVEQIPVVDFRLDQPQPSPL